MAFPKVWQQALPFRTALLALALALAQAPQAGTVMAQESADGSPATAPAAGTDAAGEPGAEQRSTPPAPPPAPPVEPPLAVYIAVNGTTTGPFDRAELAAMVASGALTDASLVWQEGMADWQPAASVEAVAALIAQASAAEDSSPAAEPEATPEAEPAAEPAAEPRKAVPGWGPKAAPEETPAEPAEQPGESPDPAPAETPAADDKGATTPEQPAQPEPAAEAFDPAQFVLGSWQGDVAELPVPDLGTTGAFSGTTTYQPDGTMRLDGVLRVTVNGVPLAISMAGTGRYAVVVASEGESFTITPDLQMTMTVPGYPPQVEAMTDPATYVVLDQDTMRDTEGVTWRRR